MGPSEKQMCSVRQFLKMAMKGELPTETQTCERHGEFESKQTPAGWTTCPDCHEDRIVREQQEERGRIEADFKRRRAEQLLGRAAIPPRFADRRLSTFVAQCDDSRRALALVNSYAETFSNALDTGASLILCGGVGTGKTHLAIGIAHRVIAMDKSALFTSVIGAIRAVKETYRRDSDRTESDVIDDFTAPDLLILDEVGVQFGSDTEKMILFEIINGRYERLKPTILISNLAKEAFAQFIGERVFDRLREGGGKLIAFDWPSYRRQA